MSRTLWQLFPLLVVGMWAAILFVLSRFGWASLASVYCAERPFEGKRWRFVDAKVGKVRWNGSLTLGVSDEGIYLAPMPFYRLAHPALFLPWSDITVGSKRSLGLQFVQLTARRVPEVPILITESRARVVALAAGSAWPAPDLLALIELRRAAVLRGWTFAGSAAIAAVVFFCAAVGVGALGVPRHWELDRNGEVAIARVTSIEPRNHNSLRYTFSVGAASYTGVGSIADSGLTPPRPGAPVTIHYLPEKPWVNCLGDPHALLINEVAFAGAVGALLAFSAVLLLRRVGFAVRRRSGAD